MKSAAALVVVVALAGAAGCSRRSSAAGRNGDMAGMNLPAGSSPVSEPFSPDRAISLPHDEPFAPPGPGRDAFVTACVVCHSTRYITSQPPFSRDTWKGIVQKMIDSYGAHVTPSQAAEIVSYLAATNGAHRLGDEGE
jgi:mono/diheme cytochrome c family protein